MTRLGVIGAGPKALALVAKAAALERAGWSVPELVVVDERGLAANWSGENGYTDGSPILGTPPEKDVGFPYAKSWGACSATINDEVRRLSWQGYLIEHGSYAEWIDRGRPAPPHRRWNGYLEWVGERAGLEPILAGVRGIEVRDGRWRLSGTRGDAHATTIDCDGLVLTGPGTPITVPGQEACGDRVTDGRTFWLERETYSEEPAEVCVIGSGETAGAVVVALLDGLAEGSVIELVSTNGIVYSRGESFYENRLYSNPLPDWPRLAERHRREFLRRTDRGVFSVQAESVLNRAEGVRMVAGRATKMKRAGEKVIVAVEYDGDPESVAFDRVVVAIGFDPLWFWELLSDGAREALAEAAGFVADAGPRREGIERSIAADLSVGGLLPRLHLPALAGVAQGPGFPNLSCLGLLSDRILKSYAAGPCGLPDPSEAAGSLSPDPRKQDRAVRGEA